MGLSTINFVILFIGVYCQLALANLKINIQATTEKARAPIQLRKFVYADLYISSECQKGCDIKSEQFAVEPIVCKDKIKDLSATTCEYGWILNWDEADLGQKSNKTTCASSINELTGNRECTPCICVTTDVAYSLRLQDVHGMVTTFSLKPQESDTSDNMVVTGVKFGREHSIIYIQIEQAKLLPTGKVDSPTWKAPGVVKNIFNLEASDDTMIGPDNEDFSQFQHNIRTLFLDSIQLPHDYVATGVKLARTMESTGNYAVRLEVKGTKVDESYRLVNGTDRWFSSDDLIGKSPSYNRARTEIPLSNRTYPDGATINVEITDTNRFIRFRATDMGKDFGKYIIPSISRESAQVNGPLGGIGLNHRGAQGSGGFIAFKSISRDISSLLSGGNQVQSIGAH